MAKKRSDSIAPLSAVSSSQNRKRPLSPGTLKRTIRAFYPYKLRILLVLVSLLLTTALGIVNPLVIRIIIDNAILGGNAALLVICSLVLIVIPVIIGLVTIGQTYISNVVGQRVIQDFRSQLYTHLQSMSLNFFTATRTGELQSRLSNDVSGVQTVVTSTITRVVGNISVVLATVFAMIYISPLLTLITLILFPISLWITYKVGNVGRAVQKQSQQSLASLTALMQEMLSVSGILLVKTFNRQEWVQKRFDAENQKLADLEVRRQTLIGWFVMLVNAILAITPAAVYLVAGWQIIFANQIGKGITLGAIVAFTALQTRLLPAVGQLLEVQVQIQGALALFDRIFECLDLPIEIKDEPGALQLSPQELLGQITFRDVAFTYRTDERTRKLLGQKASLDPRLAEKTEHIVQLGASEEAPASPILQNISFEARPGQLVALVGPSGAGKTTLTYLISRLYDVDSGDVEIGGHNIKDIALSSLNEAIGVVTQETYLFHASVRENLLFARPDATEAQMIAAAKAAAIHDVIMGLENGYDTLVGERGYRLSGGEKQRIAIARVLLKDPHILILDEATSALDTYSERLIQAMLESLMKKRTTIAIAHRLSTILAADTILVVNDGRIVERGTHHELLSLGGLYTRLYNQQFSSQPQMEEAKGLVS